MTPNVSTIRRLVPGAVELVYDNYNFLVVGFCPSERASDLQAELFPDRAGRLVLDGALDPSLTSAELSEGQAVGFEQALRAYVRDCQAGDDCPLTGTLEQGVW